MLEPPVVSLVDNTIQEQVHTHTRIPMHIYTTLILHHK